MRHNSLVALMPNLPNPSKSPNAQGDSDEDTGETVPEGSLVTCKKCFRALLVFVLRFVRDIGCDHGHQAQTNGLADLPYVNMLRRACLMFLKL